MQCDATYRALNKQGITYATVDITEHPAAYEWITEDLGYQQAPVVIVDQDPEHHWSGFRPDKVKAIAAS